MIVPNQVDADAVIDKLKSVVDEYDMQYVLDNIDDFKKYTNDVIDKYLLAIKEELAKLNRQKKFLEDMDVVTFGRDGFLSSDMKHAREKFLETNDHVFINSFDMTDMYADAETYIAKNRNDKDRQEMLTETRKTRIATEICKIVRELKYGGIPMKETDKIIEKLENDLRVLSESSIVGKDVSIRRITNAINTIKELPLEMLVESIPTDKRALNAAKECAKDNSSIEKTFGPDMSEYLLRKLINAPSKEEIIEKPDGYKQTEISIIYANAISLLLYQLSKKIESSVKSKDYKSLIYRSFIIHYMMDELEASEKSAFDTAFGTIIDRYTKNNSLKTLLSKPNYLYSYDISDIDIVIFNKCSHLAEIIGNAINSANDWKQSSSV